jgi:hypothetical protein
MLGVGGALGPEMTGGAFAALAMPAVAGKPTRQAVDVTAARIDVANEILRLMVMMSAAPLVLLVVVTC